MNLGWVRALGFVLLLAVLLVVGLLAALCELPGEAFGLPTDLWPLINAATLAAAALAAARTLLRLIGEAAPLYVAVMLGASVAGGAVFQSGPGGALLAATALGLCLVFRQELPARHELREVYDLDLEEPRWRVVLRWASVGALLLLPALLEPLAALLVLAASVAIPRGQRRLGVAALLLGAGAVLLLGLAAGGLGAPATTAEEGVQAVGMTPRQLLGDPAFLGRSALYLVAGRNVGILVGFLPLLLGLFGFEGGRLRWALLLATVAALLGMFLLEPFNFWGGSERSGRFAMHQGFVSLYPVFWFLPTRHVRVLPAFLIAALSVALAGSQWVGAWLQAPLPDLSHRLVERVDASPLEVVRSRLPFETSQRYVRPSGLLDARPSGLWLRRLDRAAVASDSPLRFLADRPGALLVGDQAPIEALVLEVGGTAPSSVGLRGGEVSQLMFRPDGSVGFEIELDRPVAIHPLWFSAEPVYLYELELMLPRSGPRGDAQFEVRLRRGHFLEKRP